MNFKELDLLRYNYEKEVENMLSGQYVVKSASPIIT